MINDYPTYEVVYDESLDASKFKGTTNITYVDTPGVEVMGVYLSKQQEPTKVFLSSDEKMEVVAPLLIPDSKIFREAEDPNTGEVKRYNISFPQTTINNLKAKFDEDQLQNADDLFTDGHGGEVVPARLVEHWLVEDKDDKAYTEYGFSSEDVPLGTWMVRSKVTDQGYWENEIKKNKKYAYSIEALVGIDKSKIVKNKIEMEKEKVTFELDGKNYELIDGKPVLIEDGEEKPKPEEKEVEAESDKEEVEAESDKEEVEAESDKNKEEAPETVEAAEENTPSTEGTGVSKEEIEAILDSKLEAVYEMIAEIKAQNSKDEVVGEAEKVEMSKFQKMSASITALREEAKK